MINTSTYDSTSKGFIQPLGEALLDAAGKASIALICGIAMRIFASAYSAPFFWLAGSLFFTRLVVKATEGYHVAIFERIKQAVYHFTEAHPYNRWLLTFGTLFSGKKYVYFGEAAAALLGVIGGMTVEIYQYRYLQQKAYNLSKDL